MSNVYYTKEVYCPVCGEKFDTTKIKTSVLRIVSRDEDFCVHYKDYNPIYYDIFICPNCGYGSSENAFDKLSDKDKEILKKAFASRKVGRNFCGVRTYSDALDSYKIAIYTAGLIDSKNSYIAGLALKTAWLYRYTKDENEKKYLEMALKYYTEAYNKENFPVNNMDELTVIYLIGEISRRLEMYDQSIYWFGKVVSHPDKNSNLRILKMAKEQWYAVREKNKENLKRKYLYF